MDFTSEKCTLITKRDGQNNIRLDSNAIEKYLRLVSLGDTPVCVISISGKVRKGKSLMLNLIRKFIEKSGWKNNWTESGRFPMDAFPSTSGRTAVTRGIYLSNEPIEIYWKKKKMMVVLMDTPGIFSNTSSQETDHFVLSISALLSSVLLFNSFETVESNELSALENAMEYAEHWLNDIKTDSSPKFQHFVFLVRDAQADSAKQYKKDLFTGAELSPEVNKSKEKLRTSFETMDLFVLSRPEQEVMRLKYQASVSVHEIGVDFVRQVDRIFKDAINPSKSLEPKLTKNGRPMSIQELLKLAIHCDSIHNINHNAISAFNEGTGKLFCDNQRDRVLSQLRRKLKTISSQDPTEIERMCKTMHSDALATFENYVMDGKLGYEETDYYQTCKADLKKELNRTIDDWKERWKLNMYESAVFGRNGKSITKDLATDAESVASYPGDTEANPKTFYQAPVPSPRKTKLEDRSTSESPLTDESQMPVWLTTSRSTSRKEGVNTEIVKSRPQGHDEDVAPKPKAELEARKPTKDMLQDTISKNELLWKQRNESAYTETVNGLPQGHGGTASANYSKDSVTWKPTKKMLQDTIKENERRWKQQEVERASLIEKNLKVQVETLDSAWNENLSRAVNRKLRLARKSQENTISNGLQNSPFFALNEQEVVAVASVVRQSAVANFWQSNLMPLEKQCTKQLNELIWGEFGILDEPLQEVEFLDECTWTRDCHQQDRHDHAKHDQKIKEFVEELKKELKHSTSKKINNKKHLDMPDGTSFGQKVIHFMEKYWQWCSPSLLCYRQLLDVELKFKRQAILEKRRNFVEKAKSDILQRIDREVEKVEYQVKVEKPTSKAEVMRIFDTVGPRANTICGEGVISDELREYISSAIEKKKEEFIPKMVTRHADKSVIRSFFLRLFRR